MPLLRIIAPIITGLIAACAASSARDEDAAARREEKAVQAWGNANPDCLEWSDGCVICRRADDALACSTPGIACEPQATMCRRKATPPPASEPSKN